MRGRWWTGLVSAILMTATVAPSVDTGGATRPPARAMMSYRAFATGANSMVAISQDWLKRATAAKRRVLQP